MFGPLLDMIGGGEPLTLNAAGELVDHLGDVVGQIQEVDYVEDVANITTIGGPTRSIRTGPTRVEIYLVAHERPKKLAAAPKPVAPQAQVTLDDGVDLTEELG